MKTSKKFKILPLLIIMILGISCEKDDPIDLTGNLVVNFVGHNNYLSTTSLPRIYIADSDIPEPLIVNNKVDNNYILRVDDLNYGNYYLEYFTEEFEDMVMIEFESHKKLFQINAGKTTTLTINIAEF